MKKIFLISLIVLSSCAQEAVPAQDSVEAAKPYVPPTIWKLHEIPDLPYWSGSQATIWKFQDGYQSCYVVQTPDNAHISCPK